jgi:hypothetical protein
MAKFSRGSKYGATKAFCAEGHKHDSKREARHCNDLHLELKAGSISMLTLQPQFWFSINGKQLKHGNGRRIGYRGDFAYFRDGIMCVDDAKGFTVRDWPLRKAIFLALFPEIQFREV